MTKELLIPAIQKKCKWANNVIVCMDSAGGHRIRESVPELNLLGSTSIPSIRFECQPTRSPDCNDLGIWNSMQSRVTKVKYERIAKKSMAQRIQDEVMAMWEEYPAAQKVGEIVKTLQAVHREIIVHNGGNSFAQPRKM